MPDISLMCFLEQDRTTTTSATDATDKPINTIATITMGSVVDADFAGAVVIMTAVADVDFASTVEEIRVAVADGAFAGTVVEVMPVMEHIDPDESSNIMVLSAFEWIQA